MRRLIALLLWFFVVLWSCCTFWYFENKVYCDITDNNVTIFLKNYSWTLKCKVYIDTIHQLALKKYNEIMAINSYISQWEDVYYWKTILDEKKSEFIHLINYKSQIISVVNRFESILFDRYYWLLQKQMEDYYLDLENQYNDLLNNNSQVKTFDGSLKIIYLEQQMLNVSNLLDASNLDDIMKIVPSYIYLKNQIEWSYEL